LKDALTRWMATIQCDVTKVTCRTQTPSKELTMMVHGNSSRSVWSCNHWGCSSWGTTSPDLAGQNDGGHAVHYWIQLTWKRFYWGRKSVLGPLKVLLG